MECLSAGESLATLCTLAAPALAMRGRAHPFRHEGERPLFWWRSPHRVRPRGNAHRSADRAEGAGPRGREDRSFGVWVFGEGFS